MTKKIHRRDFLQRACGAFACTALGLVQNSESAANSQANSLKAAAASSGKIVGTFTTHGELEYNPRSAAFIRDEFHMIASGNDLKMGRLRPSPTTYNFADGDWVLEFAQRAGLQMRGHTLVWHAALPAWFDSYVNAGNARQVMVDHITTVMTHYAGRMYAWDVVNEAIHPEDGRPDGLRIKPWLNLIGPDYIETAFRAAAAADPKARLLINDYDLEHQTPRNAQRRSALSNLIKQLKARNVPVNAVGLQSHLVGGVPFAKAELTAMLSQFQDLGLEILVTELDVDDTKIPAENHDALVAETYAEYLYLVCPFAKVITLQQLTDKNNRLDTGPARNPRADGLPHGPNILDENYNKKPAYYALKQALESIR